jgi:glyoxylase-like metal-dependent hydrolase (beta-lactamase superfamily II)
LKDGEEIGGFKVLPTPGHGKHALTLLTEIAGRHVAFCGDLIFGEGRLWNWFDCDWDYGLEEGQRALLASVVRLQQEKLDLLLPSHGEVVREPQKVLAKLAARLEAVLSEPMLCNDAPLNFPESDSPAHGWRQLLPNLHQWRAGNCAVLLSQTGNALLVDDGLCHWVPLPERAAHHRKVISDLKASLGISKIEIVIPTHYHGDHIENIPDLAALEGTEIVSLDIVAEVLEQPGQFNLCCTLPWYGTAHNCVVVNRKVPDGTRLRWHEYELEIFHLGGQTFYHSGVAVKVQEKQVLLVGDAIFGWNVQAEPVLCFNDADPQSRGWAYSLQRMIERRPDLLVCGHGSAVCDPMPLLAAKQDAWRLRLEGFHALNARENSRLFFDPFL